MKKPALGGLSEGNKDVHRLAPVIVLRPNRDPQTTARLHVSPELARIARATRTPRDWMLLDRHRRRVAAGMRA